MKDPERVRGEPPRELDVEGGDTAIFAVGEGGERGVCFTAWALGDWEGAWGEGVTCWTWFWFTFWEEAVRAISWGGEGGAGRDDKFTVKRLGKLGEDGERLEMLLCRGGSGVCVDGERGGFLLMSGEAEGELLDNGGVWTEESMMALADDRREKEGELERGPPRRADWIVGRTGIGEWMTVVVGEGIRAGCELE